MSLAAAPTSVLTVEDDPIIRADLRLVLETAGFDVCPDARDGVEAVELAREHEPDVILLDLGLPRLGGVDATRLILADRDVPIVALTGMSGSLVEEAMDAGVTSVVRKPFAGGAVVHALQDAVIARRRRASHDAIAELLCLLGYPADWSKELEQSAYDRGRCGGSHVDRSRRPECRARPAARARSGCRRPTTVTGMPQARLVGINHVALEVGDIDEALAFYGRLFELTLRGRSHGMAFVDMGDQFLALSRGRTQPPDEHRHFGLVVDDKDATRRALEAAGVEILPGRGLDFRIRGGISSRSFSTTRCSSRRLWRFSGASGSSSERPPRRATSSGPRESIPTADGVSRPRRLLRARPRAACGDELRATGAPARQGSAGS